MGFQDETVNRVGDRAEGTSMAQGANGGASLYQKRKVGLALLEEVAGILLDEGDDRCRWFIGHGKMDWTLSSLLKPLKLRINRPGFRRHS